MFSSNLSNLLVHGRCDCSDFVILFKKQQPDESPWLGGLDFFKKTDMESQ